MPKSISTVVDADYRLARAIQSIATHHGELIKSAIFVTVLQRYPFPDDLYGIHVVNHRAVPGHSPIYPVTIGLYSHEQTQLFVATFLDRKKWPHRYNWVDLPANIRHFITYTQCPMQWHGAMDLPDMANKVKVVSRHSPERLALIAEEYFAPRVAKALT